MFPPNDELWKDSGVKNDACRGGCGPKVIEGYWRQKGVWSDFSGYMVVQQFWIMWGRGMQLQKSNEAHN